MGSDAALGRLRRAQPLARGHVGRPRLTAALENAGGHITTVTAPAGYGKSALVTEWLTTDSARVRGSVVLQLELRDNDPVRFWGHVARAASALGALVPDGTDTLLRDEIRAAPGVAPEAFLATVIEHLEAADRRGILVLDDIHVITNPEIGEGLSVLLATLPHTIQTLLVGRSLPVALRLQRLGSSGALTRITASDLSFTDDEALDLLNGLVDTDLDASELTPLLSRTGGWVTGLRYAAMAIRDPADLRSYVQHFSGHSRGVSEFLTDEVFEQQPLERQRFLVDASTVSTLTGPVCDALTLRTDSLALLRDLESAGVFLTSVDQQRTRFTFQSLFRDLLLDRLASAPAEHAMRLHARASDHYAASGEPTLAVEHALAAGDSARAAELIVPLVGDLHRQGLDRTLQHWFDAIPPRVLAQTPALALTQAWIRTYADDPVGAIDWCERADRAELAGIGSHAASPIEARVAAESACLRTIAYRTLGTLEAAITWGERALVLLDGRERTHRYVDSYARLAMTDALAEAYGLAGTPEKGMALLRGGIERARDGDNVFAAVALPGKMATLASSVGMFDIVVRYVDEAFHEAERYGLEGKLPTADAYVARGELLWERNELAASADAFQAAIDAAILSRSTWIRARALLGLAKCRSAQRHFAEAALILDTAEQGSGRGTLPEFLLAQLAERRILLAVRRGDLDSATASLDRLRLLSVQRDRLTYLTAVVALLGGRADRVADRPDPAPKPDDPRRELEWAVLQFRAAAARDERPSIVPVLERAQRGPFIRTVIGPDPMAISRGVRSLRAADRDANGISPAYLRQLDDAVRRELGMTNDSVPEHRRPTLDEPFSDGELAVVRFLPTDLTYAEIAAHRHVSVNTVKTQLKSIYRKLGVTTRSGAAERSRRLGLLP
ncbi:LuxR C-terminal-related transcriptional regulator [uncultured Amnibacterium sp.]|uniref:helix-turn-helix transcriptional regulator n=1 Tax=uncultured Amnibacterium sp. TaxID=1631851 RepID=UPI0035CB863A